MYSGKVNKTVIKIVGLLSELEKKSTSNITSSLEANGFRKDLFPMEEKEGKLIRSEGSVNFFKDYFYPDFRNIMFIEEEGVKKSSRFIAEKTQSVELVKKLKDKNGNVIDTKHYPINITKTEVFLFPGQIGLFSISIALPDDAMNYAHINDTLFLIRQFDTITHTGEKWHEWMTQNVLAGIKLRGDGIKADEFSGSKFKLFTVIDCDTEIGQRESLLYDMATVSSVGSAVNGSHSTPSKLYYDELMKGKFSFFNNWEALCLFDSFTCIGNGQLSNNNSITTWEYTYFRIYLYRLFLKFNLFHYNSSINESPVKLRDKFETFLNDFNLSHISFNFMANEIYTKTGVALDIDVELNSFQSRINRLSAAIQEKKQSKTNMLLQAVTVLGGISSVQPVLVIMDHFKTVFGMSNLAFYSLLVVIIAAIVTGVLYFIMPEIFKGINKRFRKLWK